MLEITRLDMLEAGKKLQPIHRVSNASVLSVLYSVGSSGVSINFSPLLSFSKPLRPMRMPVCSIADIRYSQLILLNTGNRS